MRTSEAGARRRAVSRRLPAMLVFAVLLAGCGGSDDARRAATPAPPASADAPTARKLQDALDLQRESYGATGMVATVVVDGRPFWSGASGLADRKTRTRMTVDTPFPIFSITKMFVGALAARLAQDGRVDLDSPLARAVPTWPNGDRITLRMLLNHTSGVGNAQRRLERDTELRPRAVWTPRRTLRYARDEPHVAPGARWEYSNAGYVLAGLVIEQATGRTVAEELRDRILDPLELDDAVLQPQERPRSRPARGYGGPPRIARALRAGGRLTPYPSEASWLWTAGGMVATAPSVARFADALLRGDLLSPEWRRQVVTFVPAGDGYDGYGLGVAKGEIGAGEVWSHLGSGPGFITNVAHLPAKDLTVAVLSSGDADLRLLTGQLAEAAIESIERPRKR